MARWNNGILTDLTPRARFHREATPVWLATASALLGHRPPSLTRPFRYADLGCGAGFTAAVIAAAHPNAEVWGFDFNPACIEMACRLADRAGLTNVRFRLMDFHALAALEPLSFDVMAAENVLHIVSASVRRDIAAAIDRHVRPGGLVYLGYRTNTGAPDMVPLQTVMHRMYEAGVDVSDAAVPAILDHLDELRAKGAAFFLRNPDLARHLEELRHRDPADVAAEFLNRVWDPPMFPEVAGLMDEARCDFIGRATLQEGIPTYAVPPGMVPLLEEAATTRVRETMQDVAAGTAYRRDIYRRGTPEIPEAEHLARLDAIAVAGLRDGGLLLPSWQGGVAADPRMFDPLRRALRDGPLTIAQARRLGPFADHPAEVAASAIAMLIAAGYAHPVAPVTAADGAAALNRALAASVRDGESPAHLVSPVLGTAIEADLTEILTVDALMEGHTGAALAQSVQRGLDQGGHGPAEPAADRVPLFRAIGILPA